LATAAPVNGAVEDVFDGLLPVPDTTGLLGVALPAADEEVFAEVVAAEDELDGGAAAEDEEDGPADDDEDPPAEELLDGPPPVPWNASIPL